MPDSRDEDLNREIRSHLELDAEEREAGGMSPDEARYAARRAFGSVMRVREDARSVWTAPWIDHALQDLRHAARRLRRAPAFAITAIGILTIGISLNLAFFQLLNAAALSPLPVADLDTLVRFDRVATRFRSNGIPFPATQFIRDHNGVLSAVLTSHSSDVVWGDDPDDRLNALYVSANWFTELGRRAIVYSHSLARRRVAAQTITPKAMAHDDDRLGIGPVVSRNEDSPQRRSIPSTTRWQFHRPR